VPTTQEGSKCRWRRATSINAWTHLGIVAGVCQELGSRLARCPRSHSSPTGKRWNGHGSHDPEWLRVQQPDAKAWIDGYHQVCLLQKDEAMLDAYLCILHKFTAWTFQALCALPTHHDGCRTLSVLPQRTGVQCQSSRPRQNSDQRVLPGAH
jgi:hypothetical protein